MTECYLSFGSNMGNRVQNIMEGIHFLNSDKKMKLLRYSSLFISKAMYNPALNDFINAAACYECTLNPNELLYLIQKTEKSFGRIPKTGSQYTKRPLDIDIIFYHQENFQRPELTIPHPEFSKRKFVLYPLQQIALNYSVPGESRTLEEIVQQCPDTTEIREV